MQTGFLTNNVGRRIQYKRTKENSSTSDNASVASSTMSNNHAHVMNHMATVRRNAQIAAAKHRVKQEIEELVAPYRNNKRAKPPFTAAELIVMAVLCRPQRSVDRVLAFDWIIRTFGYYKEEALSTYNTYVGYEEPRSEEGVDPIEVAVPGFHRAFHEWHLPVQQAKDKWSVTNHTKWRADEGIKVSPSAGRLFLSKWLDPKRRGKFNFLDLPTELRTRVSNRRAPMPVLPLPSKSLAVNEYCQETRQC